MRISLLVMMMMTAVVAARAEKGAITPATMTSWKIVCDPAATEAERYAATEFQRLLKEMTGAELPLVETATADAGAVFIGPDAVRFETTMTANTPRVFDFLLHPEYDTATMSDDPAVLGIYVKQPEWMHANRQWHEAIPSDEQLAVIKNATTGGAFAYFNHKAKFGVEQRFDPGDFSALELFWNPSRQQINLEMISKTISLDKGQQARYAYEVRYLTQAPQTTLSLKPKTPAH